MVLPAGMAFDAVADGPATCIADEGEVLRCGVAVAPDASTTFSLRLGVGSAFAGRLTVVGESLSEPFEGQIDATGDVVHNSVGRGGVEHHR